MEKDLVSVFIPIYKAKYLDKALESIRNQTYQNLEIILYNDGSPEDINTIVYKHLNDNRIKYIDNKINIGASSLVKVWNKFLQYVHGEFFLLASDDDIYHKDFLNEMILLAKKYPNVNLFHSRVAIINNNDEITNITPLCPEFENGIDFMWHRINDLRYQYAPDFMCRTKAIASINGFVEFPSAWNSDDATWFELSKISGVAYSPKILFNFRYSGINITSGGNIMNKITANLMFVDWIHNFLNEIDTYPLSKEGILNNFNKKIDKRNSSLLASLSYFRILKLFINNEFKLKKIIFLTSVIKKTYYYFSK